MSTDTRIKADAIDNLLGVQTLALCISVQFIKVSHAQSQICIGEQLNCLRLGEAHEQGIDVFLDGTLLQQTSKLVSSLDQTLIVQVSADDNTRRVKIVIKSLGLTQEFRAEDDVLAVELLTHGSGVAHRDRRLDDHDGVRVIFHDQFDHSFDRRSVKVLGVAIVVGRGSDHNKISIGVCSLSIQRCCQIQFFLCEILLNIVILNRRLAIVDQFNFLRNNINCGHLMVLRKQCGN